MGAAAIWGTAVGMFGIALVLATFWENRRAADAAMDANRPWLELNVGHTALAAGPGVELGLPMKVINRGNSPAVNVTPLVATAIYGPNSPVAKKAGYRILRKRFDALRASEASHGTAIFPGKAERFPRMTAVWHQADIDAAPRHPHPPLLFIIAGVRYRYAGKTHYTIETFSVQLPSPLSVLDLIDTGSGLHADQYKIIRHSSSYLV